MRTRVGSLLVLLGSLSGCGSPRERAGETLQKVGADQLRADAALLYKNLFASTGPDFTLIKQSDWPASFRVFAPQQVGAYRDGFSLALERQGGLESGLYVIPNQMEIEPRSAGRAQFERIA
ncbi:MAG: hypothetical protein ABMA13_08735, partial [Chthoniobacteraceae bacterium]